MHTQIRRAYAAALGFACIIGFSFMFVKLALEAADPLNTLAHRFTFAFASASVALLIARRRLRFGAKDLVTIGLLSLFYPFLFFAFQTFGLMHTTSVEAGIIHATVPIITMVLASLFLKERTSWQQKAFTLLSVAGVISIFLIKGVSLSSSSMTGIALILLSALASAIYTVWARQVTRQYHLLELTFVMTLIGFISFHAMSVIRHVSQGTLNHYFDPFASPSFTWSMLYLGILSSMGSLLLSNYALTKMKASNLSVFNNLATVITLIAGTIVLHERLAYYHIIGAAMVIVGLVGASLYGQRRQCAKAK